MVKGSVPTLQCLRNTFSQANCTDPSRLLNYLDQHGDHITSSEYLWHVVKQPKLTRRDVGMPLRSNIMKIPVLNYSVEFCLNHFHKAVTQAFNIHMVCYIECTRILLILEVTHSALYSLSSKYSPTTIRFFDLIHCFRT